MKGHLYFYVIPMCLIGIGILVNSFLFQIIPTETLDDYPSLSVDTLQKSITTELGEEYLVKRYHTGGSHCCVITEIYTKGATEDVYTLVTDYSEDGDLKEITYPFQIHKREDYFHSSCSVSKELDCSISFEIVYVLINRKLTPQPKGNASSYASCLTKYLSSSALSELNEYNSDHGEREMILNAFIKLHKAKMSYDELLSIYMTQTQQSSDYLTLWKTILDKLGCKDLSVISRHQQVMTDK